jgi:hypothetical protein
MNREQFIALLAQLQALGTLPDQMLGALSVNGVENLPEVLRAPYQTLKDQVNAILAKLPATDAVPAALEASYALNALQSMTQHVAEVHAMLKSRFAEHFTGLASVTALNAKVEEFEGRLTRGELLTPAQAQELAQNSVREFEVQFNARTQRRATRQAALSTAGLPAAPDAVLDDPNDDGFNTALEGAKGRLSALSGVGLTLASAPELVTPALWDAACHANTLAMASQFKATLKTQPNLFLGGAPEPKPKPAAPKRVLA